jgi:hypothetical protein
MEVDREDEIDLGNGGGTVPEPSLAPCRALDRLLRYARSEALNQHREKAARLIEAAIISLSDTSALSKH